jgi:hypothetical protein
MLKRSRLRFNQIPRDTSLIVFVGHAAWGNLGRKFSWSHQRSLLISKRITCTAELKDHQFLLLYDRLHPCLHNHGLMSLLCVLRSKWFHALEVIVQVTWWPGTQQSLRPLSVEIVHGWSWWYASPWECFVYYIDRLSCQKTIITVGIRDLLLLTL